jgi:HPr kinase/phosphorylase
LFICRKRSNVGFMTQLHATAIVLAGAGVLIRGPSGSGKSDLALHLIDGGATLIADDRVEIKLVDGKLHLSAPLTIQGLLEVRGIGVVDIDAAQNIPLCLIADLKSSSEIERMPVAKVERIDGNAIPVIDIDPFELSAPAKIKMALRIQAGEATLME